MTTLKDSGIYCIKHVGSGMLYIGSAEKFDVRFKKHLRQLRRGTHHSYKLQDAWNKFGEGAFEITVLERCDKEALLVREQRWIDELNAVDDGYNVAIWAESPMRGKKHSEETRERMRESHKKRKPISEETREKIRQAAIQREKEKKDSGYEVSTETKAKLIEKLTGRPVSKETRAKLSASNKGQQLTEEQRAKQIASLAGRKLTEEHKAAIAEGGRRRWEKTRESMSMKNNVSQE